MRAFVKFTWLLLLLPFLPTACVREMLPETGGTSDEWVIPISVGTPSDVIVSTKGTMTDPNMEKQVFNVYVLVFDYEAITDEGDNVIGANRNKVFGHFFDDSNRFDKAGDVPADYHKNYWIWDRTASGSSSGTLHIKSSRSSDEKSENCTIVAIANLNSEMVNVTPEQLGLITDWSEMTTMPARLKQDITSRSGYFPMYGQIDNVDLSDDSFANKAVTLKRLDAKVTFNVQVDPEGSSITSFTPLKWRVVNVPKLSYVLERPDSETPADAAMTADDFFPMEETCFETESKGFIYKGKLHFRVDWGKSLKTVTVTKATDDVQEGNSDTSVNYYIYYGEGKKIRLYKTADRVYEITVDFDSSWGFWVYENNDRWTGNGSPLTLGEAYTITKNNNATVPITWGSFPVHGFSFYMLENRKAGGSGVSAPETWNYAARERRNADGTFKYAPEFATYVVITGQLVSEDGGQTSHAEVEYVVHLGDFGNGTDATKCADFKVRRNHNYTYNLFIKGIDDIRVEVNDGSTIDNYPEPGATGKIVMPLRKIFTCDSHYSTHALWFSKTDIESSALKWWVRTPFNDEGARSDTDGSVPASGGIDYKWVEFRVNYDQRNDDEGKTYKADTWTTYKPHGAAAVTSADYQYVVNPDEEHPSPTMYIDELMAFLSAAKAGSVNTEGGNPIFDGNDKVFVTAFVNEYYYETHPTETWTAEETKNLWTKFVNQPMRTMCILSTGDRYSQYKESLEEKATYIIQQHAIQTVYNVNHPDLNSGTASSWSSAWGVEYEIDPRESKCEGANGSQTCYSPNPSNQKRKNTRADNGRWNTLIEWGLRTANNATFNEDNTKWETYLNLTDDNESLSFMADDDKYKFLRYTCMSRNRDNDGDGVIDKDEVRWYLAASNQLRNLFLGSYGLEGNTGLYQRTSEQRYQGTKDNGLWRQHVVASDCWDNNSNSNNCPRVVWAEEGLSGSHLTKAGQEHAPITARCVRNLGYVNGVDITYASEDVAPDSVIIVTKMKDGSKYYGNMETDTDYKDVYLDVDCSRMNEESLRYFTDRELAPHDEHSEAACLFRHFQTTSVTSSIHWPQEGNTDTALDGAKNVKEINAVIDGGRNPYCPDGYRLPNLREIGVICYYLSLNELKRYVGEGNTDNKKYLVYARTYYSFGQKAAGTPLKKTEEWGWGVSFEKTLMDKADGTYKTTTLRCVKDVND